MARRNRVDSRTHRRDRRQLLGYRCWTLWTRFRDFYDRGPEFNDVAEDDPENYPGGENERYLEIWNLVFSEFNHQADGTYEPLPHKNIDTGMGLERMVSIIQNAPTNFETDLFMPIIEAVQELSGNFAYGESKATDISFKVIADHIRALSLL